MRKIIYLIFFFCSFLFNSQVPNVSEEEMYEVINFVIQNGTKRRNDFKIITEDPNVKNDSKYFDEKFLKSFFNDKEIKSIKEQYKTIDQFLLNPKYILNLRIIHKEKLLAYSPEGKNFFLD